MLLGYKVLQILLLQKPFTKATLRRIFSVCLSLYFYPNIRLHFDSRFPVYSRLPSPMCWVVSLLFLVINDLAVLTRFNNIAARFIKSDIARLCCKRPPNRMATYLLVAVFHEYTRCLWPDTIFFRYKKTMCACVLRESMRKSVSAAK